MQKPKMSLSSASSDEKPSPNQSAFWWLIGLVTLLLLGSAWFAWKQPPNPNINPNTNRTAASGWIDTSQYPLEQNVFNRVTVINANLKVVSALDQRVWVVGKGNRGLIVHCEEGGKSWERQTSGTETRVFSFTFQADGQQGWATGDSGTIATRPKNSQFIGSASLCLAIRMT